jgi:ApaG protein
MFEKTTQSIRVVATPRFVSEQSDPARHLYFFSYQMSITNLRSSEVTLLSRYWLIRDALGHVEEVEGKGVVGLTPKIAPGETFEYTSFCPLPTPTGSMQGAYFMKTAEDLELKIEIPLFILSDPGHYH